MSVRAKFQCVSKFANGGTGGGVSVAFQASVYGEENKTWSEYTPSGSVQMAITNPEAVAQFVVGKTYFLDFTPAD